MVALYPIVLFGAALILRERSDVAGRHGWRWFGAWALAGALFTFSYLTGFTIGLFLLPLAAAALFVVAWQAPRLAETVGFGGGVALVALVAAFLNRDYRPCGEHGQLSIPPGAPPGTSISCGGTDPVPWLVSGLVIGALAVLTYALLTRARRARP
jgi:hypothetical protein